jgi:hypothetical protein
MQRLLAIAGLTWKAAFRFRFFLVISLLLLGSVVALPLLIKDDGTARGCTQILLTYTLSTIAVLLGLCTLWLSCGTMARDIEECQIQVVAVKPIARWQIWLGKWLGILALNATMLALSGASVYGLLLWRAARLPEAEQQSLRREVLVARGSLKPPGFEQQINEQTDQLLQERIKQSGSASADLRQVRREIREQVKARYQLVPAGSGRQWHLDLGLLKPLLKDQPLQLRIKFNAAKRSPSGTFIGIFQVGDTENNRPWESEYMSLAPDTFHEFDVPPNLFNSQGVLTITFYNPNDTSLIFPLDEGIEVLYREGGFGLNFIRGIAIIFCWMALLAAVGLASASFLSFPVAAFFSLGLLTLALSTSTLSYVVTEGTVMGIDLDTGARNNVVVDTVFVPVFGFLLKIVSLVEGFSPIDSLSSGRSITWTDLGLAFTQIVLVLGGIFAVVGIIVFTRRELATAQGNQ